MFHRSTLWKIFRKISVYFVQLVWSTQFRQITRVRIDINHPVCEFDYRHPLEVLNPVEEVVNSQFVSILFDIRHRVLFGFRFHLFDKFKRPVVQQIGLLPHNLFTAQELVVFMVVLIYNQLLVEQGDELHQG